MRKIFLFVVFVLVPRGTIGQGTRVDTQGVNSTALVDGIHYPFTRAGVQSAINAAGAGGEIQIAANSKIVLDSTPLSVSSAGVSIVCGTGGSGLQAVYFTIPATNGNTFDITGAEFSIKNCAFQVTRLSRPRTGYLFNLTSPGSAQFTAENLFINGDSNFSSGDVFFAVRSGDSSATWKIDNVQLYGAWNTAVDVGSTSGTITGFHLEKVITGVFANFDPAEIVLDSGVDTFTCADCELWNGGLAADHPVIWTRNKLGKQIPRYIFFGHTFMQNQNFANNVWGTGVRLDNVQTFRFQGYIYGVTTGMTIGAGASDVDLSESIFGQATNTGITIANGAKNITLTNNAFQDIGLGKTGTYPVISVEAGASDWAVVGNKFFKFAGKCLPSGIGTCLPSSDIFVALGSSDRYRVFGNNWGLSGIDYRAANAVYDGGTGASKQFFGNTPAGIFGLSFPANSTGWILATGNGGPIQTKRVLGCTTGTTLGSTCDTSVAWTTPFPDTSYTVQCNGDGITSGSPEIVGTDISAKKTASAITVRIVNKSAAAAQFTTINCTAVHD